MASKAQAGVIVMFVLAVVFIFVFIMVNMWGSEIMGVFNEEITSANGYTNESVTAVAGMTAAYPATLDSIGGLVLVGLWILIMILGYNAHKHPLIGALAIFLVGFVAIVGMMISNVWSEMNADAEISTVTANYPMMSFVINNYLITVLVIGFSMVLAMFLGSSQSG